MATVHKLFNELIDKKKISVRSDTPVDHDNLRSRLCKLFSKHKIMLDELGADDGDSNLSLSADYNGTSKTSTFYIRRRRNRLDSAEKTYEILSADS